MSKNNEILYFQRWKPIKLARKSLIFIFYACAQSLIVTFYDMEVQPRGWHFPPSQHQPGLLFYFIIL